MSASINADGQELREPLRLAFEVSVPPTDVAKLCLAVITDGTWQCVDSALKLGKSAPGPARALMATGLTLVEGDLSSIPVARNTMVGVIYVVPTLREAEESMWVFTSTNVAVLAVVCLLLPLACTALHFASAKCPCKSGNGGDKREDELRGLYKLERYAALTTPPMTPGKGAAVGPEVSRAGEVEEEVAEMAEAPEHDSAPVVATVVADQIWAMPLHESNIVDEYRRLAEEDIPVLADDRLTITGLLAEGACKLVYKGIYHPTPLDNNNAPTSPPMCVAITFPRLTVPASLERSRTRLECMHRGALLREARMLQRIASRHIPTLVGVCHNEGEVCFVTPLGSTLESILANAENADAPLPMHHARAFAWGIARALAALHRAGYTHGALTPHHVLLVRDGTVELCDPATAVRHEHMAGELLLPPASQTVYLSPEEAVGPPTPASDVYAYGCLLYQLFAGLDHSQVDVAEHYMFVAKDCIRPNPADRPTSAQLLRRLRRWRNERVT
jgi:hypothetical protein